MGGGAFMPFVKNQYNKNIRLYHFKTKKIELKKFIRSNMEGRIPACGYITYRTWSLIFDMI